VLALLVKSAAQIRAWSDRIHLDEVDAPGSIQVDDRVDLLLSAGLGEVDLVSVTESVANGEGPGHDVLRVIGRAEDRQIS